MIDCPYDGQDGPCWGEVLPRDEIETTDTDGELDWMCLYACDGHAEYPSFGGPYQPEEA